LLAAYDRLFGMHEVTTTDAVACVRAGRHRILFATPDDFAAMHPGCRLGADFSAPAIVAVELAVAALDRTAGYLRQRRIACDALPDGRLAVAAGEASGVILFFAAT
jgi:hypothetical protein